MSAENCLTVGLIGGMAIGVVASFSVVWIYGWWRGL